MKKFAAFFAVVVLLAVAAPVFAATNPFVDVPMNSWAYDAVAQLAAKGILSGYPDGLYKGKQAMTRYEAASAIARAVAYIDMTKASKQDVDMLKKLVVEFKDELDALGVRVDGLESDMATFKKRLGGWRMSGRIRFDVESRAVSDGVGLANGIGTSMGNIGMADGRLNIERFFGEDEKAFFHMDLRFREVNPSGGNGFANDDSYSFYVNRFHVSIPFLWDSKLTLGVTGDDDIDVRFGFYPDMGGRYGNFGWFNDNQFAKVKLEKSFEYGNFYGYIGHPSASLPTPWSPALNAGGVIIPGWDGGHAWVVLGNFDFKWNEQFGFGIGGQYIKNDDWSIAASNWNNVFTGWVGVDFKFVEGASLHGMVYFQSKSSDTLEGILGGWNESGNAWRVALDISQDILNFTSFYAEYGRVGEFFWAQDGLTYNIFVFSDRDVVRGNAGGGAFGVFGSDNLHDSISYWKIGARQQWTEAVRTWLYYVNVTGTTWGTQTRPHGVDTGMRQYAIGIDYRYNPYTIFGLNYMRFDGIDYDENSSYSRIRFTTQVNF